MAVNLKDETVPALVYKRALVPVLETFLKMLSADALFLYELFDSTSSKNVNHQTISEYEKSRLCEFFFEFLEDKKKGIVAEHLRQGLQQRDKNSKIKKTTSNTPKEMVNFLKGRFTVLKFIDAVTNENEYEPIEFGYGETARPRKYIVLNDNLPLTTVILNKLDKKKLTAYRLEGITALHARTGTSSIYSKAELNTQCKDISIGLNHDRIMVERKRGRGTIDRCENLCVLPIILEKKVIGVLKAEIYDPEKKFNDVMIESVKHCLPFFAQFIVNSRGGANALTYKELCKGQNLEKLLIDISEKRKNETVGIVQEVLKRTIHLFNVFNRNTYIGWSEIAGRINHYINEIRPFLDLPTVDLLSRFEDFRRYDELLLEDVSQYREHFIHQFHTFALGIIIILEIGIDKFLKWTNNQLKTRSRVFGTFDHNLDEKSILKIWFMASFYHDYAYILQRFDKGMGNFIRKVLGLNDFEVSNDWSQIFTGNKENELNGLLNSNSRFSRYLDEMSKFIVSGEKIKNNNMVLTRSSQLVNRIWNAILSRQEHGPLSALVLLDSLLNDEQIANRATSAKELDEIYMAALAITCHHEEIFEELASKDEEPFFSLEGFPFLFLLTYCDTAQEWGRRKKNSEGEYEYSSPILHNVHVKECGGGIKELSTILCYDESDITRIPTEDFIAEIAASKEHCFKTRGFRFLIEYKMSDLSGKSKKRKSNNEDKRMRGITSIRFECVGKGDN